MAFITVVILAIASLTYSSLAAHNAELISPAAPEAASFHNMKLTKCDGQTLQDCLAAGDVPVSFASSSDFNQRKQPYNLRLAYNPAVIVLPTTTDHVSKAVICAEQSNVKVQVKSGGHSYARFSSGGQDGSMVLI